MSEESRRPGTPSRLAAGVVLAVLAGGPTLWFVLETGLGGPWVWIGAAALGFAVGWLIGWRLTDAVLQLLG